MVVDIPLRGAAHYRGGPRGGAAPEGSAEERGGARAVSALRGSGTGGRSGACARQRDGPGGDPAGGEAEAVDRRGADVLWLLKAHRSHHLVHLAVLERLQGEAIDVRGVRGANRHGTWISRPERR